MGIDGEVAVTYESGVLRPDRALDLPDHTHLVITIRRVETTQQAESRGRQLLHEIRRSGEIRLAGWRPTREELHERH